MVKTIINESLIPKSFWANAINTACYIINRALIRLILNKTPCELYFERKSDISHFHIFRCKCYVHNNNKDNLDKFDLKSDETWFIGYSSSSKTFHVFNWKTLKIKESIYIVFDEFSSSDNKLIEEKDQGD